MAFVTRSTKQSYFNRQQLCQQDNCHNQIIKNDKRIHLHKSDKQHIHLKRKKYNKQQYQQNIQQSQIQYNNKMLHLCDIEKKQKLIYNFNSIKKSKISYKTQQNQHKDQIHLPQAFYEIPSSISKQTMVKYIKPINQNNISYQKQSPGPATYEPKTTTNIQSHKFQSAELQRSNENQKKENIPYCEQEKVEKFNPPVIRCQTMNSCNFKKSPNLLNYWNRVLLKKLFHHKSTSTNKKQQDQQEEYINIKDDQNCTFGEECYNNLKRSHSYQFGKAKRFITNSSQGSCCFYQLNKNNNKNKFNKENVNFLSDGERFKQTIPSQLPLQYYNSQKSLIRSTKNRKYIAFDSNTQKCQIQNKVDKRPYYDITPLDKAFVRFSQVQINRCDFQHQNSYVPGPGSYDVNPNWNREFGCIINRTSTPKFSTKSDAKGHTNQKQQTFFLASPSTNHLQNAKSKINNKFFHPNTKTKKIMNKVFKQQTHKFYNIAPQWQKKSFNRYFSDQILPANNPIQNKIF